MASNDNDKTPNKIGWAITGQVEQTVIDPTGRPVPSMLITFRLDTGEMASVTVPVASYTLDAVRTAVSAKAATLAAVASLTG